MHLFYFVCKKAILLILAFGRKSKLPLGKLCLFSYFQISASVSGNSCIGSLVGAFFAGLPGLIAYPSKWE